MGNMLSCCLCPNACRKPTRGRSSGSGESDYEYEVYEVAPRDPVAVAPYPAALEPTELDFGASAGSHMQQHISNPEMPEDSEVESNTVDHSTASKIVPRKYEMNDSDLESNAPKYPRVVKFFLSDSELSDSDLESNTSDHSTGSTSVPSNPEMDDKKILCSSERKMENCFYFVYLAGLESNAPNYPRVVKFFLSNSELGDSDLKSNTSDHSMGSTSVLEMDGRKYFVPLRERWKTVFILCIIQKEVPEHYYEDDPKPAFIYSFLNTLFSVARLTRRCAIISWIYLERVFLYTEVNICPNNWKRIVLGAILASTIWDSQSLRNVCYSEILSDITVEDMDEIKRNFVQTLKGHLSVTASVYTKYYFDIRSKTYKGMNFMYMPLTKQRAQKLEAICGLCEDDDYNDLCRAALRRSFSAGDVIVFQRSNAILP